MHSITSNHIDPSSFPLPHYEMYFINEGSSLRGNLKLLDWPYIRKCFPASTSTFKQQQQKMNQKQTGTEAHKKKDLPSQLKIGSHLKWQLMCEPDDVWQLGHLGRQRAKDKNMLQTYELKNQWIRKRLDVQWTMQSVWASNPLRYSIVPIPENYNWQN